jgi:hypothetical protein
MTKKTIHVFVLLFIVSISAVFSSTKQINEVKNRTLIILLLDPADHNMLTKQGMDKSAQDQQDSIIILLNSNIRQAVTKYWTFSTNFIFTTLDTMRQLMKEDSKKYAVMIYLNRDDNAANVNQMAKLDYIQVQWYAKHNIIPGYNSCISLYNFKNAFSRLAILLSLSDSSPIYEAFMPKGFPSEANLKYGLDQIQNEFKNLLDDEETKKKAKSNRKPIKELTLLIPMEDMDSTLTEKDIRQVYPYPFKISSYAEIQNKILEKDETVACLMVIPELMWVNRMVFPAKYFNHYIINANKNEVLGYSRTSKIAASKEYNTNRIKIKKEYFNDYINSMD